MISFLELHLLREIKLAPGCLLKGLLRQPTFIHREMAVSHTITDRSITFCNSRMFRAKGMTQVIESLPVDVVMFLPAPRVAIDKYSTSRGMSSFVLEEEEFQSETHANGKQNRCGTTQR